jgi:poly-gamma-glutamate capsule biosynthesis protein CapA/YwtB (metallophosphatase superfamily)
MRKYLVLGLLLGLVLVLCLTGCSSYPQDIQSEQDNILEEEIANEEVVAQEIVKQGMIENDDTALEQQPVQLEENIKIVVGGDVLLDSYVGQLIDSHGNDIIWGDLKSVLDSADISVVNLENPLSSRGVGEKDKQFIFRGKPEYVMALKAAGIDVVIMANNHILDYGEIALFDTMQSLDDAGILYAGAGENVDSASAPVYINKGTINVAVVSSSHVIPFVHWTAGENKPGVASAYDPSRLISEVKTASEKADIVVAYLHWGEELKTHPVEYQKNIARMLIDAGADLVVGSHPHVVQGLEYYKGKLIAYSLGNLVFTNSFRETMLLTVEFSKNEVLKAEIIPCVIKSSKTMLVKSDEEKQSFFKKINTISFGTFIDNYGRVEQVN